jgi:DNA topoisomerase-3
MEEDEVRELVEKGRVGPLDGFISAKTRSRFSALLKLTKDAETGKYKAEYDFGDKVDLGTVEPYWTDPKTGAQLCEVGSSHVLREQDGEGWKQTFRIGRLMCQKPITREHAIQLVSEGKTEIIKGFISKKGRPFDALLKRDGGKFSWEFPPRAPKLDKDGKPVARKAKAPPDLSKGTVLGKSKMHQDGEIVETPEAYYVRRPDQDHRIVFTLKKELCGKPIPPEEVMKLFETGRTELISGFMSKRGMPFGAYLVLSKTGAKADFEFPPR